MKTNKFIFILFLISILISLILSKELNYDEFKERPFPKKIKYIIISSFGLLEKYTSYFLLNLNILNISEPYDFFFCFIVGCLIRILILILISVYKSVFNLNDNYIYNEPDNTENLYMVVKKLDEFSTNLNNTINNKQEDKNNITNNNDDDEELLKYKEIDEINKRVNDRLKKIEKCINLIEKNYNDEKNNNEKILKTIQECQQFIKKSLEDNQK